MSTSQAIRPSRRDVACLVAGATAAMVVVLLFGGRTQGVDAPIAPQAPVTQARPGVAHPARPLRAAAHDASPIWPQFERHALNALLVPLLREDEYPPTWADPGDTAGCGPSTVVRVDGRRLQPGGELPRRAFHVEWRIDRCLPFGVDGPELRGSAELDVFLEEEGGYSAIVQSRDLRIDVAGASRPVQPRFVARTP